MHPRSRRILGLLGVAAVACAYAFMGQDDDGGHRSHYALVKSLAERTAILDQTRLQVGDVPPSDVVIYNGHYYSNKAPGLAFLTLPLYAGLKGAGVRTTGDPSRMIWLLGLLGNVLPAIVVLLLVRLVGEWLEPGFGAIAATTLGLGTLMFPLASTYYAHSLVAALVFAAFVLIWRARAGASRELVMLVAAGILCGYAVTSEYQSALAAGVLGFYAVGNFSRGVHRRAVSFGLGFVVGLVPLVAYNWWAFGSPLHLSYFGEPPPGGSEFGTVEGGFGAPSFRVVADLLLSRWGLLVATPIVVIAAVGVGALYRRGYRAEAAVAAAVTALYLILNSTLAWPFGGSSVPRYLGITLPFLAVGLALTYRTFPGTTAALAAVSAVTMTILCATKPLIAWDGRVLDRLQSSDGSAETLADVVGITGWYDIVPFYALVVAAIVCVVLATALRSYARDVLAAALALAGWGVVAYAAPSTLARIDGTSGGFVAFAIAFAALLPSGAVLAGPRFRDMLPFRRQTTSPQR